MLVSSTRLHETQHYGSQQGAAAFGRNNLQRFKLMINLKNAIAKFIRDEDGLTTVEYAIAGGLVGAGVIAAFNLLGVEVARVINAITGALQSIVITGTGGGGT